MPACSIWRIFFLLSQQVRQGYGSMRQAMLVLHPQGQLKRVAMRFSSDLSNCSADWANEMPANSASANRLFLNRRMFLRNSYDLRPGVRETHFIRDQADDGSEREHPESDPDPGHQREHVGLDDRALVVRREAGEVDVEVFVQPSSDRHFRSRLLAGFIQAP